MPLMREQAVLGDPFLMPSKSPQCKPQNSLTGSIKDQPDSNPRDGEIVGYLVVGRGWVVKARWGRCWKAWDWEGEGE